jgi:hypothetical protein
MKNRVSSVTQGSGLSVHSCAARQVEAAKTLFFIAEKRWGKFWKAPYQTEMRRLLAVIFLLVGAYLTSCFKANEIEQIIGPYFIGAVDVSENMGIVYNENEDYSGGGYVVSPTVYEIEWNDKFITAKQHPRESPEKLIIRDYSEHAFDSLKKAGQMERIHVVSDSLAKVKFALNKKAGLFSKLSNREYRKNLTFYYLIDTRDKSRYSMLFLSATEFESALDSLKVGKFENKRYYEHLDKTE